jgi:hypothetical protein
MSVSVRAGEGVDSWQGGALRAALTSAGLYAARHLAPAAGLPFLGVFAALAPYPLALARLASGPGAAWLAALVAFGLIGGLTSVPSAFLYLGIFATPGLLMAEALARGRGLLRGCQWAFAWLTLLVVAGLLGAHVQMVTRLTAPLAAVAAPEFLEQMRTQGVPLEQLTIWADTAEGLRDALLVLYPATFVVMAGFLILVNAWALRRFLARTDPGWLEDGEFERLRWPLALVGAFILSAVAVAAPPLRAWGLNVLVLVAFLFALQGLAVASYVGGRLLPRAGVWLAAVALTLTHPVAPFVGLALLGLFDQWLDARRWAEPPVEED